jgi:microcystin-dependent protein
MPDSGLVFAPASRVVDASIAAIAGGRIEFYDAGTTTPKTVYSNSTLATALGTIVYLDSSGHPVASEGSSTKVLIYTGSDLIKLVVKDADGATVETYDNVQCAQVAGAGSGSGVMSLPFSELASTSYLVTSADYGELKEFDLASGNCTVVLPAAVDAGNGTIFGALRKGASNTLTITPVGTDEIAGAGSYALLADGDSAMFVSDGANGWKLWSFARPSLAVGSITSDLLDPRIVGGLAQVGDIKIVPFEAVPTGWRECDGSTLSRTTFAALFAKIGTRHGSGNGSTTFHLPDYRGRFLRVWGNSATRDPDRGTRTAMNSGGVTGNAVGSVQDDAFETHTHDFDISRDGATGPATGGGFSLYAFDGSGVTSPTGGNETRPQNAYVMAIILVDPAAAAGAAGTLQTIHNGSGAPSGSLGIDGDYYIDNAAKAIYGPRSGGVWGSGTALTGSNYSATSTTSRTIANSGSITFTTQTGLAYSPGVRVRVANTAAPLTNWIEGVCTSYASTSLVITADLSSGSGTIASWNINVAGERGAAGAAGDVATSSQFTADNRLVRTDRPTVDGKNVQQSAVTLDDSGNLSGVGTLGTSGVATIGTTAATAVKLDPSGFVELPEISSPATPASGFTRIYVKTDGRTYQKTDGGTETDLSASGGGGGSGSPSEPQGRLTLTSGVSVLTSTVSAASTIYYALHTGRYVPLYDGSAWTMTDILAELSQATSDTTKSPAACTTNSNYDLFVWNDGGTFRCTRGPAWTSDTARGTGAGTTELERVTGIWVNKIAITNGPAAQRGTYVGTVRTNSTSTVDFNLGSTASGGGAALINVWNAYNRVSIRANVADSTASWSYASTTWRSSNNSATNRISFVHGLAAEPVSAIFAQVGSSTSGAFKHGINLDSTSATPGPFQGYINSAATNIQMTAIYGAYPGLGFHFIQAMESGNTTVSYFGNGSHLLTGELFA